MNTRRVVISPPATCVPTDNAFQRRCADCPERVWVAVDMCAHVSAGMLDPLCLRCTRRMVAHAGQTALGLLPEQVGPVNQLGFEVVELDGSPALAGGTQTVLKYLTLLEQRWRLNGTMAWL